MTLLNFLLKAVHFLMQCFVILFWAVCDKVSVLSQFQKLQSEPSCLSFVMVYLLCQAVDLRTCHACSDTQRELIDVQINRDILDSKHIETVITVAKDWSQHCRTSLPISEPHPRASAQNSTVLHISNHDSDLQDQCSSDCLVSAQSAMQS